MRSLAPHDNDEAEQKALDLAHHDTIAPPSERANWHIMRKAVKKNN
jgi:hypothetical protein